MKPGRMLAGLRWLGAERPPALTRVLHSQRWHAALPGRMPVTPGLAGCAAGRSIRGRWELPSPRGPEAAPARVRRSPFFPGLSPDREDHGLSLAFPGQ